MFSGGIVKEISGMKWVNQLLSIAHEICYSMDEGYGIQGVHCVKNVRISSCSGPHFPAFGLNNSEYGYFLRSGIYRMHLIRYCEKVLLLN